MLEAVERRFSPVISWGYIAARHSQRPGMDAFSPQPTAAPPSTIRCVCVYVACVCESLSHVRLFVIPWTMARQAPLSMKCSRQEYWSRLPFPSPGDLPNPGILPSSSALQADSSPSEPLSIAVIKNYSKIYWLRIRMSIHYLIQLQFIRNSGKS